MKYSKSLIAAALGAASLFSAAAMAENHVVSASLTSFDPMVIKVQPGDTVSWDKMNGHLVNTTFTGAGMGGSIIVGEPTNLQAIVDSKPKGALKRLVKKTQKAVGE